MSLANKSIPHRMAAAVARAMTPAIAWGITGVKARWQGCRPDTRTRVYFANHSSHGDFILIWSALPPAIRRRTRPVAAADYWLKGKVRQFIGCSVFDALLVDRKPKNASKHESQEKTTETQEPQQHDKQEPSEQSESAATPEWLSKMSSSLEQGRSLIIFPEGTRNTGDDTLLSFKSGIYRLAQAHPDVEFVPVWLENVSRVLPKGDFMPVPLLCSVTFGLPIRTAAGEAKEDFLERAQKGLRRLAPESESHSKS